MFDLGLPSEFVGDVQLHFQYSDHPMTVSMTSLRAGAFYRVVIIIDFVFTGLMSTEIRSRQSCSVF